MKKNKTKKIMKTNEEKDKSIPNAEKNILFSVAKVAKEDNLLK